MSNIINFFKGFWAFIIKALEFLKLYIFPLMFILGAIMFVLCLLYYIDNKKYVKRAENLPDTKAQAEYEYFIRKLQEEDISPASSSPSSDCEVIYDDDGSDPEIPF